MPPQAPFPVRRLAVLLCCLLAACTTPGRPASSSSIRSTDTTLDWNSITLGPNDVLNVTVAGHVELSSPSLGWRVDPSGFLNLPMVGSVQVGGLTVQQAQDKVQLAYSKYFREPSVSLSVFEWGSRYYYIMGQMQKTGPFVMDRPLTVFEGLSTGGGFAHGADRRHVYLLRPHGDELEVYEFNGETPDAAMLVSLRPRDILFVRQTGYSTFQEQITPIIAAFGVNSINFTQSTTHDKLLGN